MRSELGGGSVPAPGTRGRRWSVGHERRWLLRRKALDERLDGGGHFVLDVYELHAHAGRPLIARKPPGPSDAPESGPRCRLSDDMDLERQALAGGHRAFGLKKDPAGSEVRNVGLLLLSGGSLEGRAHSGKNGAASRAAFFGHGVGGE